jgi:UDP-N-acetyl-D-mannosaminuronate dehydrogenase
MKHTAATQAPLCRRNTRRQTNRPVCPVGIVGLGYRPALAVEFAKAGFSVTGIDLVESKVARINAGDSYV